MFSSKTCVQKIFLRERVCALRNNCVYSVQETCFLHLKMCYKAEVTFHFVVCFFRLGYVRLKYTCRARAGCLNVKIAFSMLIDI